MGIDKIKKIDYLIEVKEKISIMIIKKEEQNISGINKLYDLRDIVRDIYDIIILDKKLPEKLLKDWEIITANLFRALEGTRLLELIEILDIELRT